MRVLRHYRDAPEWAKHAVVALGNFDGVHRGHRVLIGHAAQIAQAEGRQLAAMVFEPYPREVFERTRQWRLSPA